MCPVLKEVPETGRREYPLGLVDRMDVDLRPAGKGKRTMGYCACRTSPSRAKLMVG